MVFDEFSLSSGSVQLLIGVQSLVQLREINGVYVDKTRWAHQLMLDTSALFFSRPRRFGKSLLLSTIAEAYKGNKELLLEHGEPPRVL